MTFQARLRGAHQPWGQVAVGRMTCPYMIQQVLLHMPRLSKQRCWCVRVSWVVSCVCVYPPGPLPPGDFIVNSTNNKRVRVSRLVRIHSDELEDIPSAVRGSTRGKGGSTAGGGAVLQTSPAR